MYVSYLMDIKLYLLSYFELAAELLKTTGLQQTRCHEGKKKVEVMNLNTDLYA